MTKCNNCTHPHATTEPQVCTWLNCNCDENSFQPYIEKKSFQYYTSVIAKHNAIHKTIKYLLTEIPEFRNYSNKDFIFTFWHYNNGFCPGMKLEIPMYKELVDPETIRRCKQKVVEENPELEADKIQSFKNTKQKAIEEWVTQ